VISIFKKNDVLNIILLLPYAILIRLHSLIHPEAYVLREGDSILSTWIFTNLPSPILQSIIAIILVFAQGIAINVLINNHRLYRTPNTLAGMIYILLASAIPQLQFLSPALIGGTFVIIAAFQVFNTYKLNAATIYIFNAALASCFAAFIYPPYSFMIVGIFIGLATLRNFNLVERAQFLIGYAAIVWILTALYFYVDKLDVTDLSFSNFPGVLRELEYTLSHINITILVYLALVFVVLLNYYNYVKKKGIDVRKKIAFFYWLMVCSFLSLFFYLGVDLQHIIFLAIPLSFFLSNSILMVKQVFLLEVMHLCLISGLVYYQFAGLS